SPYETCILFLTSEPIQNLARLIHFRERYPLVARVGLGNVPRAENDRRDTRFGESGSVSAVRHRLDAMRADDGIDGRAQAVYQLLGSSWTQRVLMSPRLRAFEWEVDSTFAL